LLSTPDSERGISEVESSVNGELVWAPASAGVTRRWQG
jgi:hypothetical protein